MKRSHDTMMNNFVTAPLDVFTINYVGISSSLSVTVTNENTDEKFSLGLPNELPAWQLLKDINDMGARTVLLETEDGTIVAYEDSLPYSCRVQRFNR